MPMTPEISLRDEVVDLIPALRNFARRFVFSDADIDDLTQETLEKVLAHLDSFVPGTRLKSWAFTIMRNTYLTEYKRRKRVQIRSHDDHLFDIPVSSVQPLSIYTAEVSKALVNLPAYQREALLLIVEGVSYDDAAQHCGCEVGTIKSRVSRARTSLARILGETSLHAAASIQ